MLRTDRGWCLIDWDTTRLAHPERDLWTLTTGDAGVPAAYEEATGVAVDRGLLELYRLRWDLAEIAVYGRDLQRGRDGDADDEERLASLRVACQPERWSHLW